MSPPTSRRPCWHSGVQWPAPLGGCGLRGPCTRSYMMRMVEYWAYLRLQNWRALAWQKRRSFWRLCIRGLSFSCSNLSSSAVSSTASSARLGESAATMKWPWRRRMYFCSCDTRSLETHLDISTPVRRRCGGGGMSTAAGAPAAIVEAAGAGGAAAGAAAPEAASEAPPLAPAGSAGAAARVAPELPAAAAAPPPALWERADCCCCLARSGTVTSHWSPLNMGICEAEVMSANSSAMEPNRSTTPFSLAEESMRVYHA
mmetsp:Transcript_12040/g.35795  ORF Transcript_12040/g.35795 Transcript_12040/m.35795 type:complete len:258 (+) Transcript_12040:379-1152(+)